ncbi:MAG: hypothetical protein AAF633_04940, partial [Chloroflexota bacterium]
LAPDPFVIKNAFKEVDPLKWTMLSIGDEYIWGEYARPNGIPFRVKVNLETMALHCSCNSLKTPCRYVIALLLLYQKEPNLFQRQTEKPDWLLSWVAEIEEQPEFSLNEPTVARLNQPSSADLASAEAVQLMKAGMAEFSLWLRDLIDDGLATLPQRAKDVINPMVDRLYDANANQVASDLKQLITLYFPKKGNPPHDWPAQLLRHLGRFYLITQAWSRFDQLSHKQKMDLILASGMHSLLDYEADIVLDDWIVIGRRYEVIGRQTQRRIWLFGLESGRSALIIDDFNKKGRTISSPLTGYFYRGAVHLASAEENSAGRLLLSEPGVPAATPTYDRLIDSNRFPVANLIEVHRERFIRELTQNPWLVRQPAIMKDIYIRRVADQWYVVDENENGMQIKHRSNQEWYLFAHSLGRELTLFGELRQAYFEPLSIWEGGFWQDLIAWGRL